MTSHDLARRLLSRANAHLVVAGTGRGDGIEISESNRYEVPNPTGDGFIYFSGLGLAEKFMPGPNTRPNLVPVIVIQEK